MLKKFKIPVKLIAMLNSFGIGINPIDSAKTGQLSYSKLRKFISKEHPIDPDTSKKFELSDSIGVHYYGLKLATCCGCLQIVLLFKRLLKKLAQCLRKDKLKIERPESMLDVPSTDSDQDSEGNDTYEGLSKASIYIGEGPFLYLQIIKTFFVLFALLTILNIPLYILYSGIQDTIQITTNMNFIFEILSLGNIGRSIKSCAYSWMTHDLASQQFPKLPMLTYRAGKLNQTKAPQTMSLSCPVDHYIQKIDHFGFLNNIDKEREEWSSSSYTCDTVYGRSMELKQRRLDEKPTDSKVQKDYSEFFQAMTDPNMQTPNTDQNLDMKHCSHRSMFNENQREIFTEIMRQSCFLKNECKVDIENLILETKDQQTLEPQSQSYSLSKMMNEECFKRMFKVQATSPQLLMIVSCVKDYMQLPSKFSDKRLHKEELGLIVVIMDILSVMLMFFIFFKIKTLNQEYIRILDNNVISMSEFTVELRDVNINQSSQDQRILKMKVWLHFTNLLKNQRTPIDDLPMEVADVQLSLSKQPKHKYLFQLAEIKQKMDSQDQYQNYNEMNSFQKYQYQKQMKKYQEKFDRILEKYKEAIRIEEKYASNVAIAPKSALLNKVNYIYLVFKNIETRQKVLQVFKKEPTISLVFRRFLMLDDEIKDNLELDEQYLDVNYTVEPDQLQWENIGNSSESQRNRKIAAVIIQLCMVVIVLIITFQLKKLSNRPGKHNSSFCLEKHHDPEFAYNDQLANIQLKQNLARNENPQITQEDLDIVKRNYKVSKAMGCYCSHLTSNGMKLQKAWHSFEHFNHKDSHKYCLEWIGLQIGYLILEIIASCSIVLINAAVAVIFKSLSQFKKLPDTIQEQKSAFGQIFFFEYFNMGCIFLLTSFDPTGVISHLQGHKASEHISGFESKWYFVIGTNLCMSLVLSAVATNITEFMKSSMAFFQRCLDRRCKVNVKKNIDDEDDDEVNTKKLYQDDLNKLYQGGEFEGEKNISRMMSTMLVLTTYSSGMPFLYLIGAMFFGITYIVQKFVLLKFYTKSLTLNRVVPTFSMEFLSLAITIHMIIGFFMFTNPKLFLSLENVENYGQMFKLPKSEYQNRFIEYLDSLKDDGSITEYEQQADIFDEDVDEDNKDLLAKLIDVLIIRLQYYHQAVYFSFCLAVLILYILNFFIGNTIISLGNSFYQFGKMIFEIAIQYMQKSVAHTKELGSQALDKSQKVSKKSLSCFVSCLKFCFYKHDDEGETNKIHHENNQNLTQVPIVNTLETEDNIDQSQKIDRDGSSLNLRAEDEELKDKVSQKPFKERGMLENISKRFIEMRLDDMIEQPEIEDAQSVQSKDSEETRKQRQIEAKEKAQREQTMKFFKTLYQNPWYSSNIYNELSIQNLKMSYDRALDDLSEINRLFKISSKNRDMILFGEEEGQDGKLYKLKKDDANFPLRENFLEICYNSKVPQSNVVRYLSMLRKRIEDIQQTIDHHFQLIKIVVQADRSAKIWKKIQKENQDSKQNAIQGNMKTNRSQKSRQEQVNSVQNNKDNKEHEADITEIMHQTVREMMMKINDLQFHDKSKCTYEAKLALLDEFEEALIKEDKKRKENRRGILTICRMQGSITQSYNVLDSTHNNQKTKNARDIYYKNQDKHGMESEVRVEQQKDSQKPQMLFGIQNLKKQKTIKKSKLFPPSEFKEESKLEQI